MQYWKSPPEPGSLREVIATSVLAFEEYRGLEYLTVMAMSMLYSSVVNSGKEAATMVLDMLKRVQSKFFGINVDETLATSKEADEIESFKKFVETSYIKIGNAAKAAAEALPDHQKPRTAPVIFNPKPEGERW